MRFAGTDEIDAALLLGVLLGYGGAASERLQTTVDAVRRELGRGTLLYRYTGEDGLRGGEGAFTCCSFWLVDALANDVGLFAEEIDPHTGEFLGNTPQALVRLALINAAVSCANGPQR